MSKGSSPERTPRGHHTSTRERKLPPLILLKEEQQQLEDRSFPQHQEIIRAVAQALQASVPDRRYYTLVSRSLSNPEEGRFAWEPYSMFVKFFVQGTAREYLVVVFNSTDAEHAAAAQQYADRYPSDSVILVDQQNVSVKAIKTQLGLVADQSDSFDPQHTADTAPIVRSSSTTDSRTQPKESVSTQSSIDIPQLVDRLEQLCPTAEITTTTLTESTGSPVDFPVVRIDYGRSVRLEIIVVSCAAIGTTDIHTAKARIAEQHDKRVEDFFGLSYTSRIVLLDSYSQVYFVDRILPAILSAKQRQFEHIQEDLRFYHDQPIPQQTMRDLSHLLVAGEVRQTQFTQLDRDVSLPLVEVIIEGQVTVKILYLPPSFSKYRVDGLMSMLCDRLQVKKSWLVEQKVFILLDLGPTAGLHRAAIDQINHHIKTHVLQIEEYTGEFPLVTELEQHPLHASALQTIAELKKVWQQDNHNRQLDCEIMSRPLYNSSYLVINIYLDNGMFAGVLLFNRTITTSHASLAALQAELGSVVKMTRDASRLLIVSLTEDQPVPPQELMRMYRRVQALDAYHSNKENLDHQPRYVFDDETDSHTKLSNVLGRLRSIPKYSGLIWNEGPHLMRGGLAAPSTIVTHKDKKDRPLTVFRLAIQENMLQLFLTGVAHNVGFSSLEEWQKYMLDQGYTVISNYASLNQQHVSIHNDMERYWQLNSTTV